jgi:hypothetical protein
MVDKTAAKSTDLEHPEDVHNLCAKTVHAARTWKPVADELWRQVPAPN